MKQRITDGAAALGTESRCRKKASVETASGDQIERVADAVCVLTLVMTTLYFGWHLAVYLIKKFVVH